MKMVSKSEDVARHGQAENKSDRSGSAGQNTERSTTTEANGGTRSSPPRVGGTGVGEAQSVKAGQASVAQKGATETDVKDTKAATSGSTTGGPTAAKRDAR